MNDLFIYLLFSHVVGDFFLQSKSTAVKKDANNSVAFFHVSLYTLAVILITLPLQWDKFNLFNYYVWATVIFVPHFIIDRWSLADKYLKLINGRSLEDFLDGGHQNIPDLSYRSGYIPNLKEIPLNYRILRGGFSCIVYVVIDGTMHLACLWFGYKLIF